MNDNVIPIPTMSAENEDNHTDVNEPDIREELITLAEYGDINYTTKQIRKANRTTLERIRRDYLRKQTSETNELIADSLITKVSELLDNLEMIDESDDLEKELQDNKLLKRDLKNIVGHITPYIPLVGLQCGGVIIGKHVLKPKPNKTTTVHEEQSVQWRRQPENLVMLCKF